MNRRWDRWDTIAVSVAILAVGWLVIWGAVIVHFIVKFW